MKSDAAHAEAIFLAALEIEKPEERAAYVEKACRGDLDLQSRVAELLRAHDDSQGPLDAPPPGLAGTVVLPTPAQVGMTVGPYKLLQQIGEGGMGIVYMAEQSAPVRRKVALKIIKPGMDTHEVIARFEAERQALAMMDHPNIARVFDGGATPEGRPYFVMELVRGIPVTQYCDQNKLPVHERLELFINVCHAVQHAHQKGIIHRDIKPSNVLVTLHDGRPVPKVIDFGVAKATGQQLTEKTLFTRFAQMVGTPLYMSPEQAELTGLDVDTRSDIYSLGVLLYELLTGSTPFESGRLKQAALDEIRRIIREEEPPSPSLRLSSTKGNLQTAIAEHRRIDPRGLSRLIRGELDWIVMKALEKDRARRYETANGFARDIERYLNDEPVSACPPSTVYRLKKFARRNKGALSTVALVALALLIGTGLSVWQAVEATRARNLASERLERETQARQEADAQRRDAEAQRQEAQTQRQQAQTQQLLAEANFQKALEAVDKMLLRVADENLVHIPGMKEVRSELLNDALRFYQQFLEQKGNDREMRLNAAQAWHRVAQIRKRIGDSDGFAAANAEELALIDGLLDEVPENRRYLELLVENLRQNEDEARLNRALATSQRLQEIDPDNADYSFNTAEIRRKLSLMYTRTSRPVQAIELIQQSVDALRRYVAVHSDVRGRMSLVGALTRLGWLNSAQNFDKADQLLIEAEALAEAMVRMEGRHRASEESGETPEKQLAGVLIIRAAVRSYRGTRVDEQQSMLLRAIALHDEQFARYPELSARRDPPSRSEWARAHTRLAGLYLEMRKAAEAEPHYREVMRFIVKNDVPTLTDEIPVVFTEWAIALRSLRRVDDPEFVELGQKYVALLERKIREPAPNQTPGITATLWVYTGRALAVLGDMDRARAAIDRAVAVGSADVDGQSANFLHFWLFQEGKYREALPFLDKTLSVGPGNWLAYQHRAFVYFRLGRFPDALADLAKAVEVRPGDVNNITTIPAAEVAACADESFRSGMLALAGKTIELTKGVSAAYIARAAIHFEMGNLGAARQDLDASLVSPGGGYYPRYQHALLCLAMRDEPAWRTDCQHMLQQFRESKAPDALHFTAWTCVIAPDSGADLNAVLDLTARAMELGGPTMSTLHAQGAALFRAGRFDEALTALEKSENAVNTSTSPLYGRYFRALAMSNLGQHDAARQLYDQTAAETATLLEKDVTKQSAMVSWNRRITLELLRAEAARTLAVTAAPGARDGETVPREPQ